MVTVLTPMRTLATSSVFGPENESITVLQELNDSLWLIASSFGMGGAHRLAWEIEEFPVELYEKLEMLTSLPTATVAEYADGGALMYWSRYTEGCKLVISNSEVSVHAEISIEFIWKFCEVIKDRFCVEEWN